HVEVGVDALVLHVDLAERDHVEADLHAHGARLRRGGRGGRDLRLVRADGGAEGEQEPEEQESGKSLHGRGSSPKMRSQSSTSEPRGGGGFSSSSGAEGMRPRTRDSTSAIERTAAPSWRAERTTSPSSETTQ